MQINKILFILIQILVSTIKSEDLGYNKCIQLRIEYFEHQKALTEHLEKEEIKKQLEEFISSLETILGEDDSEICSNFEKEF